MTSQHFVIQAADGHAIGVHHWPAASAVGTVIWLHGMAEHGGRYQALGERLSGHGWNLYCPDHRGHGSSLASGDLAGHFADQNGWALVMDDLATVIDTVSERESRTGNHLPLVLGGHSMGSFLALAGAERHGERLDGLVLCGSDFHTAFYYRFLSAVLRWQQRRHGARGHSALIDKLTFQAWARSVPDGQTEFDWLSSDPQQVAAYMADPLCGFQCTVATWLALVSALAEVQSVRGLARLPPALPILLLGGRADPMSRNGKGMDALEKALRHSGRLPQRLDCAGGRHEILNDRCVAQVHETLLAWLDQRR